MFIEISPQMTIGIALTQMGWSGFAGLLRGEC
jgi:hypothetical protein